MAKYGNILTVFNSEDDDLKKIEPLLIKNQCDFLNIDTTFFIETNSRKNTSEVIADLNELGIRYIFYHNNISDGSLIKSTGIDDDKITKVYRILFE